MRTRSILLAAALALAAANVQAGEVMLRAKGGGANTCLMANGGDARAETCNAGDSRQRFEVIDPATITAPKPPVVLPTDPPASTPDPKPVDPPKADPVTPDPKPSAGAVPLFSDRHPSASYKAGNKNPHWGPYPLKNINGMVCLNNIWGASGPLASGWQSMGAQDDGSGGTDVRAAWSYGGLSASQLASRSEVTSYPSCIKGQTPSGSPASPDTMLPKRVGDLKAASYSYKASQGSATRAQNVSDIWVNRTANCRNAGCRVIEIMWLDRSFGGYNVPCAGCVASAGRSAANLGDGPNPHATITRTTIGGRLVDVFDYTPGTWGGGHRLVKLIPVEMAGTGASRVDVLGILAFLKSKGRMSDSDYLGSIEVGWEPVADRGATTGDVTMRGLRIEVQ